MAILSGTASTTPKGEGKGRGEHKRGSKGKGKGSKGKPVLSRFQVKLEGKWSNYRKTEDVLMRRAFLVGQPNCKFHLRGQDYEYNFKDMLQNNMVSGRSRQIRPPVGMKAPSVPLLPTGPMIVINVPGGSPSSIVVDDPNNAGKKITVAVPPNAKPGAQMAVPVPEPGQDIEEVVQKQRGWSCMKKVAVGAAVVGPLAVGGVILGEHLSDGAVSDWAPDAIEPAIVEATAGAETAVEWIADAAVDAGEWIEDAAEDVGEWTVGAAEDVGEWFEGPVADWCEDAYDDVSSFVVNLF